MSIVSSLKFIANHPLNRDQRISSLWRFVKWQFGSRLVPGAVVYDWVEGAKFVVRTGQTGLTGNIYTGLHEFADMAYLLHVLRVEDIFVDIGANVGSYTILASSVIGAKTYAFEPVPGTYDLLVQNVRINQAEGRVTCLNQGVAACAETISFSTDSDTMNHALASGEVSHGAIAVPVTPLDTALSGACPSLIKIDVEGYETPVLQGAEETLKNNALHSVIMEINGSGERYGFDESLLVQLMRDYGFRTYSYDPFGRVLTDLGGKNLETGNTLFIRNDPLVRERLRDAPEIQVHGKSL